MFALINVNVADIIKIQTNNRLIHIVFDCKGGDFMAEQVLIQFRADKALKQDVADIYEQLGMDLPTAFRMFMKKSRQVRGLPFAAVLGEANAREDFRSAFNDLRKEAETTPEMTLEEINAEISAARADRKRG